MISFHIPLPVFLGLQVLVVAAAFVAVILVLSEQQKTEFRTSLYKRLSLHQSFVLQAITRPLVQKMTQFDLYVEQYVAGYGGTEGVFNAPSDDPNTLSLDYMIPFLNHFYIIPYTDPSIIVIMLGNMSNINWPEYENRSWPTAANTWFADESKIALASSEMASLCIAKYPVHTTAQSCIPGATFFSGIPYDTSDSWGDWNILRRKDRILGHSEFYHDPAVSVGKRHALSYTRVYQNKIQPYPNPFPRGCPSMYRFTILIRMDFIVPMLYEQTTLPTSRSAVFGVEYDLDGAVKGFSLIAAVKDWPDFNMGIFFETGSLFEARWSAGATPDPVLNALYEYTKHMFVNKTDSASFEIEHGGNKYVASVGRIYHPENDVDWIQLEYTPREDFFGDSDRARLIGIIIGVIGALVVLMTCLTIWLAIQVPLRRLHVSMALAAYMRNDEVVPGSPLLSEINDLNTAFLNMNDKLLAARPFLPQSLLKAFSSDNDVSGESEEEGAIIEESHRSDSCSTLIDMANAENPVINGPHRSKKRKVKNNGLHDAPRRLLLNGAAADSLAGSSKSSNYPAPSSTHHNVEQKRVAILAINSIGFHDLLLNGDNCANTHIMNWSKVHTAFAKLIEMTVGEERGIVDYFHGDRFVCGFNTARSCGNAVRNAAEAAAKIWDRFQSAPSAEVGKPLISFLPNGLAMGLGFGRATVANHGTDTMQRLATLGAPFSDAMRLQEVMSRKVLAAKKGDAKCGTVVNALIIGRCLVMGRVIQDLEASKVYCQIVGGIAASDVTSLTMRSNERTLAAFIQNRNADALRADNPRQMPFENFSDKTILVASVVSSSSVKAAKCPVDKREQHESPNHSQRLLFTEADEWLYELQNEANCNPFTSTNLALYKLWNEGVLVHATVQTPVQLIRHQNQHDSSTNASDADMNSPVPQSLLNSFSPEAGNSSRLPAATLITMWTRHVEDVLARSATVQGSLEAAVIAAKQKLTYQ